MFNQRTNPTFSTTGVSALRFIGDRTRFEMEEIADAVLAGYAFDSKEWSEFGLGDVSDAWVGDLRACLTDWERGHGHWRR